MMNLGNRLLNMIEHKSVSVSEDTFKMYFDIIFPCPNLFMDLLKQASQEVAVENAKKVVRRLAFSLSCPMPDIYPLSLLSMEYRSGETAEDYFAQDHFIHSVYLYMLGIYLFFSHKGFQQLLLEQTEITKKISNPFSNERYEKTYAFIRNWKFFSLYHDIGYVFEKPVDTTGKLLRNTNMTSEFFQQYNKCESHISYELALKSFSNYLLYSYIASRSDTSIKEVVPHIFDCAAISYERWKSYDILTEKIDEIKVNSIKSCLSSYSNYNRLYNVSNMINLGLLSAFLNLSKYIVFVYNQEEQLCAVKVQSPTQTLLFFCDELCNLTISQLVGAEYLGSYEALNFPYTYDLFVDSSSLQATKPLRDLNLTAWENQLSQYLDTSYKEMSLSLSFLSKQACFIDVSYEICMNLAKRIPMDKLGTEYNQILIQENTKRLQEAFATVVSNNINRILDRIEKTSLIEENKVNEALADVRSSIALITENEILDAFRQLELNVPNNQDIVYHCLFKVYHAFLELLQPCEYPVKVGGDQIKLKLFNVRQKKAKSWYKHMRDNFEFQLKQLGFLRKKQKFSLFFNYKHPYGYLDHGIVSSSLLSDVLEKYMVFSASPQFKIISYAFPCALSDSSFNDEIENIVKTSGFAILIHNIWGKNYYEYAQNEYKQDMQKNAFSFFAALCDNLQIWNRPHQYDPSRHSAPQSWYITDVDIEVVDNSICVRCNTNDLLGEYQHLKQSYDDYLLNAKQLIKLTLRET